MRRDLAPDDEQVPPDHADAVEVVFIAERRTPTEVVERPPLRRKSIDEVEAADLHRRRQGAAREIARAAWAVATGERAGDEYHGDAVAWLAGATGELLRLVASRAS